MKLSQYLNEIEQSHSYISEGDELGLVLNEELLIETSVKNVIEEHVLIDVDQYTYDLLESAGLLEDLT